MQGYRITLLAILILFFVCSPVSGQIDTEKTAERGGKKLDFELSLGVSFLGSSELGSRIDFLEGGLRDTLGYYQSVGWRNDWDSVAGEFKKLNTLWPVNGAINYRIKENISLRIGGEFAFGKKNSQKTCNVSDQDNNISVQVNSEYQVSYFMPYVGCELELNRFSVYAHIGYNFARFTYDEKNDLTNLGNQIYYNTNNRYTAHGSGLAFTFGGKFHFGNHLFLKLEYLFAKPGNLTGDRSGTSDNWLAGSDFDSQSGDYKTFEHYYEYSDEWIKTWELSSGEVTESPNRRNIKNMKLNLSAIRIMVGFRF